MGQYKDQKTLQLRTRIPNLSHVPASVQKSAPQCMCSQQISAYARFQQPELSSTPLIGQVEGVVFTSGHTCKPRSDNG